MDSEFLPKGKDKVCPKPTDVFISNGSIWCTKCGGHHKDHKKELYEWERDKLTNKFVFFNKIPN